MYLTQSQLPEIIVMAYSLGASIALDFVTAMEVQVAAMILIDPVRLFDPHSIHSLTEELGARFIASSMMHDVPADLHVESFKKEVTQHFPSFLERYQDLVEMTRLYHTIEQIPEPNPKLASIPILALHSTLPSPEFSPFLERRESWSMWHSFANAHEIANSDHRSICESEDTGRTIVLFLQLILSAFVSYEQFMAGRDEFKHMRDAMLQARNEIFLAWQTTASQAVIRGQEHLNPGLHSSRHQ